MCFPFIGLQMRRQTLKRDTKIIQAFIGTLQTNKAYFFSAINEIVKASPPQGLQSRNTLHVANLGRHACRMNTGTHT